MSRQEQDAICRFLTNNGVALTEADRDAPWRTLSQQPVEKIEAILPRLPLDLYPTTEAALEDNQENVICLFLLMGTFRLAAEYENQNWNLRCVTKIESILLRLADKRAAKKQIDFFVRGLTEKSSDRGTSFRFLMLALSWAANHDDPSWVISCGFPRSMHVRVAEILVSQLVSQYVHVAKIVIFRLIDECTTEQQIDFLMQRIIEKSANGKTGLEYLMLAFQRTASVSVILKLIDKCTTEKQRDFLIQGLTKTDLTFLIEALSGAVKNKNPNIETKITSVIYVIFDILKKVKKNFSQADLISLKEGLRNPLKAYLNSMSDVGELKAILECESSFRDLIDCRTDKKTNQLSGTRILLNERIATLEKQLLPNQPKTLLTALLGVFGGRKQVHVTENAAGEELGNMGSVAVSKPA